MRGSAWSEELAAAITVERYKIGTGLVPAAANLPFGVMYTTAANPCYLDGVQPAGQVKADVALANFGMAAGCSDFSAATPAAASKGFLFRWSNSADPLVFGEYLKLTIPIRQLTGEADNLTGGISWNSVAFTATESDDDELLSSEPLKVGLKMIDPSTTAAIGDYVWLDGNANGRQDAGETKLAGVVVSLYNGAGQPVTQTVIIGGVPTQIPVTAITDVNGYYCFPGLTPNTTYNVRLESLTNFGNGGNLSTYSLTTPNTVADDVDSDATLGTLPGSPVTPRPQISSPTLGAGTQTKTYDFGFVCPGSINGYAWMDTDKEGDQDNSEMALSGITVTLRDATTNAAVGVSVMTNAGGNFTLSNVPAGNYYVEFTTFPGTKVPTNKDLTGNDNNDSDVNANGRTDVFTLSACDFLKFDLGLKDVPTNPASICGTAWDDLNKNGTFEASEPGMANVTVQLLSSTGFVLNTTVTDLNGDYCFTNLDPNVGYQVAFVPPAITIMFSAVGPDQDVDLMTGVTTATYTPTNDQIINDVDAGFMGPVSIGNLVWNDVNDNGLYENTEATFSGITVNLIASDGTTVLATTTTDANGRYLFKNLMAGNYFVETGVPTGGFRSSTDITSTPTPNSLDSDDNGVGKSGTGLVRSTLITLTNTGGTSGDANWTEADAGVLINGCVDPAVNQKAYYTVDFSFVCASAGTGSSVNICPDATTTIDLFAQLTGEDTGGIWTADAANPSGGTFNAAAGTFNPTGASGGAYNFTYTFAASASCPVRTATVTINVTQITLSTVGTNATICIPANGAIVLTVTGATGPNTYDWSNDGPESPDNDLKDLSAVAAGTYTVTVTDANGCTATTSATITGPAGPSLTATPTPAACPGSASGSIDLTPTGAAPFTYAWSNMATTQDISGLLAGSYTVTVTDAGSCVSTISATITANANPVSANAVPTAATTCIPSNGSIDLTVTGGVAVITYLWSNLAITQDLSNLATGSYTVTVTDGNGCIATTSATITGPAGPSLTATPTPAACPGSASGSINLTPTGSAPFTYVWSNMAISQDISGLLAGAYTVTVTDAGACVSTISATITENANPVSLSLVPTASSACSPSNGSIDQTVTGGVAVITYIWSNLATTQDLSNLAPGMYAVTTTDGNGCSATGSATVGGPTQPSVSLTPSPVLCFGGNTGGIVSVVSPGSSSGPYTYVWSNMANTANLTGLFAGTYTVTITDAGGCTATNSTTVTQPSAALGTSITVATTDCVNGNVDLTVTGGTPAYTYLWSTGAMTQDIAVPAPGTYTVTVTDANLCTKTASATYGGCDKGDLVDTYGTTNANSGASHVIVSGIKIGATVDAEADGQPSPLADGDGADEDGFVPTAPANMLVAGQTTTINIPLMNMTGVAAKLTMYFDWNNDGDIADLNEMYSVSVPDNATTVALPVAVPANAVLNTNLGTRIRLTTSATMAPTGFAPDGEVEDYLIQVMGFDYGDLADGGAGTSTGNYNTTTTDNGPSHKIIPTLKLGASVDAEANGQPSANADGDDSTTAPATDDENGVTLPMFVTGIASNVDFTLMNMTGSDAKLTLFIDWNKDGDFLDAGEMFSTTVANLATTASISVTPPLTAVLNMNLGVRVRLSTDATASMLPTGPAPDGEVEDYVTMVMGFDYGDLYDPSVGTGTAPTGTPANYQYDQCRQWRASTKS